MADESLAQLTYTVKQAGDVLNISPRQVRYLIERGTLRTLPGLGRRTLISRAWLARWVEEASERSMAGSTAVYAGREVPATGGPGRGDGNKGPETARSDTPERIADAGSERSRLSA